MTIQVAHNASVLGAIVGKKSVLNELGHGVKAALENLPRRYPELTLGEHVIMPNHIHMIFDIKPRESNKKNHLGFLVGRFKGATAFLYGKLKHAGMVPDIGEHLWQCDYWDDLISSKKELSNFEQYIVHNPKNWTQDRWGHVTKYMFGEDSLLNMPKRAFVASQEYAATDFVPHCISPTKQGTSVSPTQEMALVSTFTSRQEREVLRRALHKKRRIIQVCPQGIPPTDALSPEQQLALAEKRLLFLSPQPTGACLNKKVATWCNEYVLRQATEIWVGDISPNGMLATLLKGLDEEFSTTRLPADTRYQK